MKIKVAWIGKSREPAFQSLTQQYLQRIAHYCPIEGIECRDEAGLLKAGGRQSKGQTRRHTLILLDSGGRQFSSEELAKFLRNHRDNLSRPLLFAVGPADGFSEGTLQMADFKVSFGPMMLAHELARVVLLEQLYRAFTILEGHPYHKGH